MERFNLSSRILLFSVCSSIEYDLRRFILESSFETNVSDELYLKSKGRNKFSDIGFENSTHNEKLLLGLDLGDLYQLIVSNHIEYRINFDLKDKFISIFDKIIPIRNRVMHARPFDFADRTIMEHVLETLDKQLPIITWSELINTRKQIVENPSQILIDSIMVNESEDQSGVYHNLPLPEFDDTGFVGRKEDIKELKKIILNNKSQIITIVGNGGIGKTAIAIKCLYDIIDNPETSSRFESIIWVSLKTKSLTSGEFKNIKNAVITSDKMYLNIQKSMIPDTDDAKEDILSFMSNFKTLLVIDNLETIVSHEIIDFLKNIPEISKVLITSRNGVGELENRYKLAALEPKDSERYFMLLCKYYGLALYERDKKDLKRLLIDDLYSSPLSIKWFVTSIYFGASEEQLIANKDDLISFSMSNIIDKLESSQKEILHLFLLQGRPLVYGEIDFYLNNKDDSIAKNLSILLTTSMLEMKGSNYQLNKMAKEYLSLFDKPTNNFVRRVTEKRKELNEILQSIQLTKEANPFEPYTLFGHLESDNIRISAYYLMQALEKSKKNDLNGATDLIQRAQEISPGYFEIYKINAFINAESGNLYEAIESYRTSIENASPGFQRATVYYLFSKFYRIRMNDSENALKTIEMADKEYPNSKEILLEKVKVLTYLAKFDEAEELLLTIAPIENDKEKYKNIYASRYADVCLRKGKQYDRRDQDKKIDCIKQSIEIIDGIKNIDQGTVSILIKALIDLSYMSYNIACKRLLEEKIVEYFPKIVTNTNRAVSKLKTSILNSNEVFDPQILDFVQRLSVNYKEIAKNIKETNVGIIINIVNENYGFVQNYYETLYFKIEKVNYPDPLVGDKVNFEIININEKKVAQNLNIWVD